MLQILDTEQKPLRTGLSRARGQQAAVRRPALGNRRGRRAEAVGIERAADRAGVAELVREIRRCARRACSPL